jgi:hypothetical protein
MIKRDDIPILIKFTIAITTGNSQNAVLTDDWETVYATIANPSGDYGKYVYGVAGNFDVVITLNANQITRKIKSNTAFLINEYPTKNFQKGNYEVVRIFPEYNGEIKIGLKSISGIGSTYIYYLSDDGTQVYKYQINFDSDTMRGYIKKNDYCPLTRNSTIWTTKPINVSSDVNLIKYIGIMDRGVTELYKPFKEIIFEQVA